jgi:hypothetical protein
MGQPAAAPSLGPPPVAPNAGGTPSMASDSLACPTRRFRGGIRDCESAGTIVRLLLGIVNPIVLASSGADACPPSG